MQVHWGGCANEGMEWLLIEAGVVMAEVVFSSASSSCAVCGCSINVSVVAACSVVGAAAV